MLRSFRVANYKSIREEQELLLMPAYDKSRLVVPVTAVFGANASGKSNLLGALAWMQSAVRGSFAEWAQGVGVPRAPFKLDAQAADEPSFFVIEIVVEQVRYNYGFSVDDKEVLEEWLHAYPHGRKRVIFERFSTTDWTFGSTVPVAKAEVIRSLTRENSLFLTVAASSDLDEVQPVFRWFRHGLRRTAEVTDLETRLQDLLASDQTTKDRLLSFAQAADLGITDIFLEDDDAYRESLLEQAHRQTQRSADILLRQKDIDEMLRLQRNRLAHDEKGSVGDDLRQIEVLYQQVREERRAADGQFSRIMRRLRLAGDRRRVSFLHSGGSVPLGLGEESAGTRAWLMLVTEALLALRDGGVLIADEIDVNLHPNVTELLVGVFRNEEANPNDAQLIFTSHDVVLLDEDTLGRDEIWFVEKDPATGVSKIFPLSDFKPRSNENRQRRYLAGAYGAVPVTAESTLHSALARTDAAA